jgi:hypothetical protein
VLIEAGRILLFGEDYRVTLASRAFGIPETGAAVHVEWLRRLARFAGRRGSIALLGSTEPGGRFAAKVGDTTYRSSDPNDDRESLAKEDIPVPEDAQPWQLEPADFTKGGAVAIAAEGASCNRVKARFYGVHIDARAGATNGHMLTQRPMLSSTRGLDLFLTLPAIQGLLHLVKATAPSELVLHRKGDDVWVVGSFDGGTWTLRARRPDIVVPQYEEVSGSFTPNVLLSVDAADMRELWNPLAREKSYLSLFRDGSLLVWQHGGFYACPSCLAKGRCPLCAKQVHTHATNCRRCGWRLTGSYVIDEHPSACKPCKGTGAEGGIAPSSLDYRSFGTNLREMPTEGPIVTLSSCTVPTLIERLPKRGSITVEVQTEERITVAIGGILAAPASIAEKATDRGLPHWLWFELERSFEAVPHRDIVLPPKLANVRRIKPVEAIEAEPPSSRAQIKVAARKPAREVIQAEPAHTAPEEIAIAPKPVATGTLGEPPCKPSRARRLLELVHDTERHGIIGPKGLSRRPREQERNAFDTISLFAFFNKLRPRALRWFLRALGQPVPRKSELLTACIDAQMRRWWPSADAVAAEARAPIPSPARRSPAPKPSPVPAPKPKKPSVEPTREPAHAPNPSKPEKAPVPAPAPEPATEPRRIDSIPTAAAPRPAPSKVEPVVLPTMTSDAMGDLVRSLCKSGPKTFEQIVTEGNLPASDVPLAQRVVATLVRFYVIAQEGDRYRLAA